MWRAQVREEDEVTGWVFNVYCASLLRPSHVDFGAASELLDAKLKSTSHASKSSGCLNDGLLLWLLRSNSNAEVAYQRNFPNRP